MVRFARAEGSKACNKRILEEPTPWKEMTSQMKLVSKSNSTGTLTDMDGERKKIKISKKIEKPEIDITSVLHKNQFEQKKKKNPENKQSFKPNQHKKPAQPNQIKTKIKQKRVDHAEPLLENQEPSKKKKNKKIKGSSNCINVNVAQENKQNTKINKKLLDLVKREYEINDQGQRVITSGKRKRAYFDLPYEEGEKMTRYDDFWVKKEEAAKLDELKNYFIAEGLDNVKVSRKMMKAKRLAHKELRKELVYEQCQILKDSKDNETTNGTCNKKNLKKNETIKSKSCSNDNAQEDTSKVYICGVPSKDGMGNNCNKEQIPLVFEENDVMTLYDNAYWVKKHAVPKLNALKNIKRTHIIKNRVDGNKSLELSAEEEIKFNREMKKEKRNESRKLKIQLCKELSWIKKQKTYESNWKFNDNRIKKTGEPARNLGINYVEANDMVKFDGFWVKKEAADRLHNLRVKLQLEGLSEFEVNFTIQKERRKEEHALKNERKIICFKCRGTGHMISACPQNTLESSSDGHGVCYSCGSLEHTARECSVRRKGGSAFSHATCFVCHHTGHIARECPDNPKGLYPTGGCCNECGSVEHLKMNCPELLEVREGNTIKLKKINNQNLEALDTDEDEGLLSPSQKKLQKIVKFD